MGNLPVPVVHSLRLALIRQVEDIVHLFNLEDLSHVFKFMQKRKEYFLIKKYPHTPAFGILLNTFLLATTFYCSQIDWNRIIYQYLFDGGILAHYALN
jgi:hypothetical protein